MTDFDLEPTDDYDWDNTSRGRFVVTGATRPTAKKRAMNAGINAANIAMAKTAKHVASVTASIL